MSESIYRPYFYIIQHINSGKYYAGSKYARDANPDNLLKSNGYQTSSDVIQNIILEEGLESFVIKKIKVFETGKEALDYESRFLRRVNASFNDNFLNRSNCSMSTLNVDWEKTKKTNLDRYGCENVFQNEYIKEKIKQTNLEKYGYKSHNSSPEIKEKYKKTNLERYGVEYPMQSEDIKEKIKQTNLERYGHNFVLQSEEVKNKSKQTNLLRYGVENPSQSEDIKEKIKQTNLLRYGVENPMQSEDFKNKYKQKRIFLSNQPTALEILNYNDKYSLKLGPYWVWKSQEVKEKLLEDLKTTYGEL